VDDINAVRPMQLQSGIKRTKVHTTKSHKPKTAYSLDKFERKTFRSNGMFRRQSGWWKQSGKYRMADNISQEESLWEWNITSNSRITSELNS